MLKAAFSSSPAPAVSLLAAHCSFFFFTCGVSQAPRRGGTFSVSEPPARAWTTKTTKLTASTSSSTSPTPRRPPSFQASPAHASSHLPPRHPLPLAGIFNSLAIHPVHCFSHLHSFSCRLQDKWDETLRFGFFLSSWNFKSRNTSVNL